MEHQDMHRQVKDQRHLIVHIDGKSKKSIRISPTLLFIDIKNCDFQIYIFTELMN